MRHLFAITVLFVPLFLPLPVVGDELEAVIVTDTEITEVGDVELSEFTGSTERITHEQLARAEGSIAQALAHEAGIQYRQAGGTGSFSTITVRAATASQTQVFYDGVLLNNAASGGVDLSQLELLNLDSIEVYRGATPIQLGIGAIGGAVNLRSRQTTGNSAQVLSGFGSFNEKKLQLSRQWRAGGWDMTTSASHVSADNDFDFSNDNGTPLNPQDDRRERRHNSDFSRNSALVKIGRQLTQWRRYDGSLQIADRDQALPHWQNRADSQTLFDTGSLQLQVNRRTTATDSQRWNHTEGVFFNRSTEDYDDRLGQLGLGTQNTRSTTNVAGARSYWEMIGNHGTLAANLAVRHEALDHKSLLDSSGNFSATRNGADGALQYSLFSHEERLLLAPSLRLQSLQDDYDGVDRNGRDGRNNVELTPQFGLRWQQTENLSLTGNVGQHYREPVFFELFGDRGLFTGNNSLVAEEGINLDIGVHWFSGAEKSASRRSLSITGFASWRDELIVSVYDSRGIGRSINNGKARVFGLETKAEWQWNSHWHSRLSLTAQSALNQSTVGAFNGKQLPGEAQLVAFASLQYQRGAWRAWYEADLVGERFYDSANLLPAEENFAHNVGVSFSRNKFSGTLRVNNLSNDNIEDFNGFPKPGRSIHLNFKYTFDGAPV